MAATNEVAIDAAERLYVVFFGGKPMMSDDQGMSWHFSGNIFYSDRDPLGSVPYGVAIGASPTVRGLAYAWIQTRAGRGVPEGARTVDGGATWQVIKHLCTSRWIVVDPDPTIVYTASLGEPTILRSQVAGTDARCEPYAELPEGITALAMSADGSRFWAGTSGGLYRSRDRGLTWEAISNLPSPGEWRALAVPPLHPDTLFALNQDGRLWFYREPAGAPAQIPSQPPG